MQYYTLAPRLDDSRATEGGDSCSAITWPRPRAEVPSSLASAELAVTLAVDGKVSRSYIIGHTPVLISPGPHIGPGLTKPYRAQVPIGTRRSRGYSGGDHRGARKTGRIGEPDSSRENQHRIWADRLAWPTGCVERFVRVDSNTPDAHASRRATSLATRLCLSRTRHIPPVVLSGTQRTLLSYLSLLFSLLRLRRYPSPRPYARALQRANRASRRCMRPA